MLNEAKVQKMNAAKQIKKQEGASMIEYALVVAVVVAIGAAFFTGTDSGVGGMIATKLTAAGATAAP
jgi:pilus assembly protein Flp/PilA